jgi:hypothetical protein
MLTSSKTGVLMLISFKLLRPSGEPSHRPDPGPFWTQLPGMFLSISERKVLMLICL